MTTIVTQRLTGSGGPLVRRIVLSTAIAVALVVRGGGAADLAQPAVQVTEERGLYRVIAEFLVPQPAAIVKAVLSDYEAIPRFMPDVKSSRVVERGEGHAVVEQEAVARLMMFSRKIQLLLEVTETPATIEFRDRGGKSFARYDGAWGITEREGQSTITYHVQARPAFDVPEFILKRLLKRDASRMIENLRAEIAARAAATR